MNSVKLNWKLSASIVLSAKGLNKMHLYNSVVLNLEKMPQKGASSEYSPNIFI